MTPDRKPRILIDAHMVGERESGNERYMLNLIRALRRLSPPAEFLVATAHPEVLEPEVNPDQQWRLIPVSASPWRRLLYDLPAIAARERATLMHVTYTGPVYSPCPMVVTVHDVSYWRHPEWFSRRDLAVLRTGVAMTVRRARGIITVSHHARSEISACYHCPESRIQVTHEAADPWFCRKAGERTLPPVWMAGAGIRGPYVLAVGNLQPRKNLNRLVAAFAQLKREKRVGHQLVFAGRAKWRESELFEVIRREGLMDDVVFPGYLPDEGLADLYREAAVFVYPSLYEGFGLPVLEAMACGAPVITSNVASIPEVAGSAAVMVDPLDVQSLKDALSRVLADEAVRHDLSARGEKQAALFSWEKTAQKTWEFYQAMGAGAL